MSLSSGEKGRFARWLQAARPGQERVTALAAQPATSGFSNETFIVEVAWASAERQQTEKLVVRRTPAGRALFQDYDLALQFEMMRAMRRAGIAAPEALWLETDASILGAPFLVMAFVEGQVASGHYPGFHGHGLFFEADVPTRRSMWFAALEQVVKIHALDWRALGVGHLVGAPADGEAALDWQIEQVERWVRFAEAGPLPTIGAALEWVKANRPPQTRTSLLWGDARPGNLIYRNGAVAAVLDWELAGFGAPEFDLAYFILSDAVTAELNQVARLAGLPEAGETIAAYEQMSGRKVENYAFAEIFTALRFAALLVLVVKMSPAKLNYASDFLTNNIPTQKLAQLLAAV